METMRKRTAGDPTSDPYCYTVEVSSEQTGEAMVGRAQGFDSACELAAQALELIDDRQSVPARDAQRRSEALELVREADRRDPMDGGAGFAEHGYGGIQIYRPVERTADYSLSTGETLEVWQGLERTLRDARETLEIRKLELRAALARSDCKGKGEAKRLEALVILCEGEAEGMRAARAMLESRMRPGRPGVISI